MSEPEDRSATAGPMLTVRELHRSFARPRTSLLRAAPRGHALRGGSFEVTTGQRSGLVGATADPTTATARERTQP